MKKAVLLALSIGVMLGTTMAQLKVVNLLTENLQDPLGIDISQPRFAWQLQSDKRNTLQTAYEIKLGEGKKNTWSTGKVQSDASVYIPYNGPALKSGARYNWQVRVWDNKGRSSSWSQPATFQMGILDKSGWKAKWIEAAFSEDSVNRPAQYFRKKFAVNKKIASASLFITAHGLYEAQLNGKRIGDYYLAPGWTSYNKRLQYQVYDVTDLLNKGSNALGVSVGNGWYRSYLAWENNKNIYGKTLGLFCQLQISYTDGTTEWVVTDNSWKSSTGGIVYTEIYHGETYDSRLAKEGWTLPGYDDSQWQGVAEKQYGFDNLLATYNEPIKKRETFKPVKIFKTPAGEQVIDFGQNLVGWVKLSAKGNPGDSVVIKHAEVLDKAGNIYLDNLRGAKAKATYILKGGAKETFEPAFTFFGFRYIRIDNYPGEIDPDDFTAIALYSVMKQSGNFSSSNPLINQLQHNIQWGQRGNFLDVPTDCPQRDERLGWTGDAQVFARTASFNFDVHNFFSKWLKDLAADQVDGSVPWVIPNVLGPGNAASTGWADAATIIPWTMYIAYGDKKVLEDQYESMKAWVGFMERNSVNDLWNRGFHFGDWLFFKTNDDNDGSSAVSDKYMLAQCYFAYSTQLLVKTATVLGKTADADRYNQLLKKVKDAFLREYVTPSGRLASNTQTAYTLALSFDMLPESMRAGAVSRLVENIVGYYGHLTTGFLGTSYLCHVLSRFGHTDVAYKLLMRENYPSWLYPVKMGATTIWERWDGIKPDSSFQTPGMNSFNHYAYGAIGDWMYRVVAGIDTEEDAPGYKKIIVKPQLGGKLTYANAVLQSNYGRIYSGWKIENGQLVFDVEIPANTTASVYIPAASASTITESGQPLENSTDLKPQQTKEKGYTLVTLGSGKYQFRAAMDTTKQ